MTVNAGIKSVVVDIENDYCKELRDTNQAKPDFLVDLGNYIIQKTKEYGLNLVEYNNFRYLTTEFNLT